MRPTSTLLSILIASALLGVAGCSHTGRERASDAPARSPAVATAIAAPTERVLTLTPESFAPLPRIKVVVQEKDGTHTYEGVRLHEILSIQGVAMGKALRGGHLTDVLIVEASDGYRVAFTLPELDPAFTDRVVLLADTCDGGPIAGKQGERKLIIPDEKMHARWVRGVTGLRLRSAS